MSWRSAALLHILVLLLAVSPSATSIAAANQYVEDFTTTTYRDGIVTSADWDTSAGELRLHPFEISLVGTYDTPSYSLGVVIAGDYAYVADSASGLQVIDITDPTNPVSAGDCNTSGYAQNVAIAGDHAYVADGGGGLTVVDISDPTSPFEAGAYLTGGYAVGVALSGDYAYVADNDTGLQVVDISDPTTPVSAGSYLLPGIARGVTIAGDYAYVADDVSGLLVLDISDPTNPSLAGTYDTPDQARAVAIAGDYAYVADDITGLLVLDISDPTNPALAATYDTPNYSHAVVVAGDRAYVADRDSGLQIVDISDPTNPVSAGSYDTPTYAYGVAVAGEYAYVGGFDGGLQVIKVGEPAGPALAGTSSVTSYANDLVIVGDYAYVACDQGGLDAIDISDPTNPVLAGNYDTPNYAHDVVVAGDYAYVADRDSGLQVIDISDPTNPAWAGDYDAPTYVYGVAIAGDRAYLAAHNGGLLVLDVSDPTTPALLGDYDTPGYAQDVTIAGDYAYVADANSGVRVVDISDPANPVPAGSYVPPGWCHSVAIAGDYAYVASGSNGLEVVDISDPTNPVAAGYYATTNDAASVAVSGDHVYLAIGSAGLQVLDVSDPTNPVSAGILSTQSFAYGVAVDGHHAFLANGAAGLFVAEIFQSFFDPDASTGQSLDVEPAGDDVLWARVTPTQTESIAWELSADGGTNWEDALPGGWQLFTYPGSELFWRSTHEYAGGQVNPTCTALTIDWLIADPATISVLDIPDDQGRQVRVAWQRSGYDFVESPTPITEYAVYRRIDEALSKASGLAGSSQAAFEPAPKRSVADLEQSRLYPPGSWDYVTTVPAFAEDEYSVVVPTLVDSTIVGGVDYSVFFVRAATAEPGVYFDAPPDSGYSVDNLAPSVPAAFAVDYNASENELVWEESGDDDFQYFRIYRGTSAEFVPDPGNLVHMTTDIAWIDLVTEGWQYHYKVSAVDFSGNESDAASPETMTGVPESAAGRYALYQNAPNPLNPTTTIRYDVPSVGGRVTLEIFDVSGRRVRQLLDRHELGGQTSVVWDGRDDGGAPVASGVYYYRLTAPGYEKTLKMTVLK